MIDEAEEKQRKTRTDKEFIEELKVVLGESGTENKSRLRVKESVMKSREQELKSLNHEIETKTVFLSKTSDACLQDLIDTSAKNISLHENNIAYHERQLLHEKGMIGYSKEKLERLFAERNRRDTEKGRKKG